MPSWVPVIISAAVLLFGIGSQLALFAFFLGKMQGTQKSFEGQVDDFKREMKTVTDRLSAIDGQAEGDRLSSAKLSERLHQMQRTSEVVERMQLDLTAFRATTETERRHEREEMRRLHSDMQSLQRQMANLASYGPGKLVEMPAQG